MISCWKDFLVLWISLFFHLCSPFCFTTVQWVEFSKLNSLAKWLKVKDQMFFSKILLDLEMPKFKSVNWLIFWKIHKNIKLSELKYQKVHFLQVLLVLVKLCWQKHVPDKLKFLSFHVVAHNSFNYMLVWEQPEFVIFSKMLRSKLQQLFLLMKSTLLVVKDKINLVVQMTKELIH